MHPLALLFFPHPVTRVLQQKSFFIEVWSSESSSFLDLDPTPSINAQIYFVNLSVILTQKATNLVISSPKALRAVSNT